MTYYFCFNKLPKSGVMKSLLYVIAVIFVIYWAIAFFALHAAPTIHIVLFLALATFIIGNRYGHGHFLE